MLVTVRGVIRDGKVELSDGYWPDGTEVVVVAQRPFSLLDTQKKQPMTLRERQALFDEYSRFADEHPADEDIELISDEELLAIVHEVRSQRK